MIFISLEFRHRLRNAIEDGVILFAKYALLLALIYGALQFANGIVAGSMNGTTSTLYLNELIEKGYLPRPVNGRVPPATQPKVQ